jgi:phosphatidylserine/phosphatidylglycerophosphate/cardiolipin synthase-like enzyme
MKLANLVLCAVLLPSAVSASTHCDSAVENCYPLMLNLIRAEPVAIYVGQYYIKDRGTVDLLARRRAEGVTVRIITDPKAAAKRPEAQRGLARIVEHGLPTLQPVSRWFHVKAMVFVGQGVLLHGSANLERHAFTAYEPLVNYRDETIEANDDPLVVAAALSAFDDWWTSSSFQVYTGRPRRTRLAPSASDPRVIATVPRFIQETTEAIDAELVAVDANVMRFESDVLIDALIRAHQRGVRVRIQTEFVEWSTRPLHKLGVQRMLAAGIPVRIRVHLGNGHSKSAVFHGQRRVVHGSSNWSDAYNVDLTLLSGYNPGRTSYYAARFARRWGNTTGYVETRWLLTLR